MVTDTMTAFEVLNMYRHDVNKLAEYLEWLEVHSGKTVSTKYTADGVAEHSAPFPVYDSMLLMFIKEAEGTCLMDRNYRYVYSRNRLKNTQDELDYINQATILQMAQLGGILSNYVLGGRTRARLWSDGVTSGVFYQAVKKAKELVDFWTNAESAN